MSGNSCCYIPGLGTHASVRTRQKQRYIEFLPYTGPRSALTCCPTTQLPPCSTAPQPCLTTPSPCPLPTQIVPNYSPRAAICAGDDAPVIIDGKRYDLPTQSPLPRPTLLPIPVTNQRPRSGLKTARLRDQIASQRPPQWAPPPPVILPCPPLPPQKLNVVPTAPLECSYYPRFKESSGRRH